MIMALNYLPKAESKCNSLSGIEDAYNYWEPIDNRLIDKGLKIKVAKGDKCAANPSLNYEFEFNLSCNPNLPDKVLKIMNENEIALSKCKNVIVAETKHGKIMKIY